MEVYKTPSKEIQEIILANLTYETAIEGLNGYFASEPRNEYITVKMESDGIKQDFALYEAEAWADILITWLRTKHGVFYYPGMEAKYAKTERIQPFSERKMDEGALKSLKALYKCVIGQEIGINSHALIADAIKCAVSAKESEIKKMKKRITELEYNFKAVCDEDDIFRARALKAEEEVQKLKVELNTLKDTVSKVRSRLNNKFVSLPGYEEDLVKLADIAVKAVDARDETISRIKATAQKEAKQECYKYLWDALSALNPECDALKITDYEKLVDRIFYEMSLINDSCKRCRREHTNEKFSYIQRVNKAEEELKELKEKYDQLTTALDISKDAYRKLLDERNQPAVDAEKRVKSDILYYIIGTYQQHGFGSSDIYSPYDSLTDVIDKLIERYNEANHEIENLRSQIDRLKDLINAMNEEVKDM